MCLGIGRALSQLYLGRADTTVIATVRNLEHSSVDKLRSLPVATNSRLITIKIDSASPTDAEEAVQILKSQYKITKLDTLIANAGIGNWMSAAETTPSELEDHLKINTVGPFILYTTTKQLLLNSKNPKFIVISTELASIGMIKDRPLPALAYGVSKAAINYLVVKLHHEESSLIAVPIHPGWVKTGPGNRLAVAAGMEEAPLTLQQSATGLFEQLKWNFLISA
ncbi:hypothetical protein FSARC_8493 [Fusarium sarcochroum]|uniref:NAD(P)-binding protein n=1 Tax=Fusarium sarcochroum TaxID=1208366 RepID=A0A8H4X750_9HYPO|nr:hypothetical protein FSARC_8493 [Fusarium sarcochroum]